MKVSIAVTGIDEALDKLETLKRGTRNKHVRKAVRAGIAPQIRESRSAMTFADDTGKLRRSIISKIRTYTTGVTSGIVGPRSRIVEAYSRSKKRNVRRNPAKYAHLVEFGHKARSGSDVAARPFMGPAFDRSKDEATAAFKAKLVESVMAEASQ